MVQVCFFFAKFVVLAILAVSVIHLCKQFSLNVVMLKLLPRFASKFLLQPAIPVDFVILAAVVIFLFCKQFPLHSFAKITTESRLTSIAIAY